MNDSQATRSALIVLLRAQRNGMSPAEKAKRKKSVRWLYPWATENHYRRLYQEWVKPVRVFVHEFLEKHQESVLRGDAANAVVRQDAVAGESFALMVRSLNGWVNAYISDDEQKKLRSPIYMGLGDVSQSAFNFNSGQYNKSVKSALGVNFPSDESWWPDARKQWQDTNYEVIRSDIRKYISDINSTTEQAVTNGWSVKMLSEQIMALDSKITKSRAAFIARDQIGKLNGIITQKRMEDIGLTMYEWSSSSDERVRESHALMDGKLCRWDDATVYSEDGGKTWKKRPNGAVLMHPGMDYQCRCCALAWFNELIDEADGVMPGSASSEPTIPTETGNQPQPAKEPEPMEKVKKSKRKAEKTVEKETPSEETSAENLKIFYNLLLEDEESVKKDVRKITKEHQEFLCKYAKDMQGHFYYSEGAHYDPKKNVIRLNIKRIDKRSTEAGFSTDMTTFLHESGHWLDYNMLGKGKNIHGELPKLREYIRNDALNYANSVLAKDKVSIKDFARNTAKEKALLENVADEVRKKSAIRNGISDLLHGASNGKIADGYWHDKDYWKEGVDNLEAEAIAHFFAARGTGGERLSEMKSIFPTAYKYFEDFIKGY